MEYFWGFGGVRPYVSTYTHKRSTANVIPRGTVLRVSTEREFLTRLSLAD